jgi:hypothetical protein
MKSLFAAMIVALSTISAIHADSFRLEGGSVMGYAESKRFEFPIRFADLREAPEWPQNEEHPPLPARRTERIAKEKLKALLKEPEQWKRAKVVLRESELAVAGTILLSSRGP